VGEAKAELEYKIYDAIGEAYPDLTADAYNQWDRLWGQAPTVGRWTRAAEEDQQQVDSPLAETKKYITHRQIERDHAVIRKAKRVHGTRCRCCNFDFEAAYGALGAGYIEAHHLKPLAALEEGQEIEYDDDMTDFTVLCANCHRMIHRMDDLSDLKGLQKLLKTDERLSSRRVD
jgi:predicted HNH restriction endonuclease